MLMSLLSKYGGGGTLNPAALARIVFVCGMRNFLSDHFCHLLNALGTGRDYRRLWEALHSHETGGVLLLGLQGTREDCDLYLLWHHAGSHDLLELTPK